MPKIKSALRRSVGSSRSSGLLYPAQDVERAIAMSEASAHLARLESRSYKFMTTKEKLLSRGPVVVSYPVEKTLERKNYEKITTSPVVQIIPAVAALRRSVVGRQLLYPTASGSSVQISSVGPSEIFRRLNRQAERYIVDRVPKVEPALMGWSEEDQIRIASKVCIEREERRQVMAAKGYLGKKHDVPTYNSESAINCAEILKKIRYRR